MFYSFELQMAGVILLTAMAAGGVSLWIKRRRAQKELDEAQNDEAQNFWYTIAKFCFVTIR